MGGQYFEPRRRLEATFYGKIRASPDDGDAFGTEERQVEGQPAVRPRRTSQRVKLIIAGGVFQVSQFPNDFFNISTFQNGRQYNWRDDSLTLNYSGSRITS